MAKKTKKTLDRATLLEVVSQVAALEKRLEANAARAAKQGGNMLAHAAGEHTRATACALILTTILDPMVESIEED